jgi:2'-5' RNA ligase
MSYFLGFVPDKESVKEIQNVVKEANSLFSDFGIPVRWVKPDTYHITLYYLGENYPIFNQMLLKKKLSKIKFREFKISFQNIKVGISRSYKELVYLDLSKGGEELRELLSQVRKEIGGKDTSLFIPHLTLGRISEDLSKEEYRNVSIDIAKLSKKLNLDSIEFSADTLYLIQSKNGVYSFKMKFEAR